MSGHSHWKKIKHQKGVADLERGKTFSKTIKLITVAARGGSNPEENPRLKVAIAKAKEVNMPTVNVERAIKRGAGETGEVVLEEMVFEAYGPGNIAIIIEGITDNSNRSVAEVKQILGKNNGKLAAEGSVRWLFERKGEISLSLEAQPENLQNKEALELLAIDLGAEDISWDENLLQIYTNADNIGKIKSELEAKGIEIESSGLGWRAKDEISVSEKDVQLAERLFAALDESDDVQEIYSNLKS